MTEQEYIKKMCDFLAYGNEYPLDKGYPIEKIKDCYLRGLSLSQAYDEIV